ncbi:MAG: type II toxin-antitoxin system RelE/ParE family toxin [Pirellulales bacterium]|nr:type II toxin-antitoxin system RelE/ParE family toxin [Pirellulales bacterium]
MTSGLLLTSLAWGDLREIGFQVAKDNPAAADRLLDEIEEQLQLLAANPDLGEVLPHIRQGQYRRFTVRKYVIYYVPTPDGITVARVLHGARDHEKLL